MATYAIPSNLTDKILKSKIADHIDSAFTLFLIIRSITLISVIILKS